MQLPQHTVYVLSAELLLRISEARPCAHCRCLRHCKWLRWCHGVGGYYDVGAVDFQGGNCRPSWKTPPGAAGAWFLWTVHHYRANTHSVEAAPRRCTNFKRVVVMGPTPMEMDWADANLSRFALRGSVVPGQSAADGLWNLCQTSTMQFLSSFVFDAPGSSCSSPGDC